MAIVKCIFCGKEQEDYKGTYLLKNDGSVNYYSSSKCMKNHLKLKRDKRKTRWTEAFRVAREKRIAKTKERAEKIKEKASEKNKVSQPSRKKSK